LTQVAIVSLLVLLLGVRLNPNPLALLGVVLIVLLGADCFSLFSLMIACLVKTRDRFMGIGQLMTMPLFLPAMPSTRFR
jgi:ABC-2 type transport system permease protein